MLTSLASWGVKWAFGASWPEGLRGCIAEWALLHLLLSCCCFCRGYAVVLTAQVIMTIGTVESSGPIKGNKQYLLAC